MIKIPGKFKALKLFQVGLNASYDFILGFYDKYEP